MTSHHQPSRQICESSVTAEQLLEQAASIVRERRHTYGRPKDLFARVPGTWTALPTSRAMPASWRSCHPMRSPRSCLGRHQPAPVDTEAAKRAGWRQHGILVVAEQDPRLTTPERKLVRRLGEKLCGQRLEDGR
jgi:hypothetical protein